MSLNKLTATLIKETGMVMNEPKMTLIHKKAYKTTSPINVLIDNFRLTGIWLWRWSLDEGFEPRVKNANLVDVMNTFLSKVRPSHEPLLVRDIGKVINSYQLRSVRCQFGDYGRSYGWKWENAQDLSNSMYLFNRSWLSHPQIVRWNADNLIIEPDATREDIEADLIDRTFTETVEYYHYDILKARADIEAYESQGADQ